MSENIKLNDAIAEFVSYIRLEVGQSSGTITHRRVKLQHFSHWLEECFGMANPPVKQIELSHLRLFVQYLADERKLVAQTVRGYLESLRGLYGYLLENEYIKDSPAHRLKMPKRNAPHRELVTNEELVRLFEATELVRPRKRAVMARAILACFVYGGLRSAEVRNLRLSDIAFEGDDCFIAVRHGKGDKRRVLPLHREAIAFLRAWLAERGVVMHDYVFVVDKRRRLGLYAMSHWFEELKFLARIDRPQLTPHALRHSYATRLLADGIDLYHLRELLGHANIDTTIRYVHSDLVQLTNVAQRGGLFGSREEARR